MQQNNFTDIMEKNHMEIPWHDYTQSDGNILIDQAGLIEKASVIGRVGLIMLSCGTGAWRVRTSMNRLSKNLGVTCTVDVGLMSIEFNCFDGKDCVTQSLSIANTGVNTSKLYRMEQFVDSFPKEEVYLTGEEIHKRLDEIERIHAIYSPVKLGLAAALACCAFTFLLGGGPVEMILAFLCAGVGNVIRTKLIKHNFTLFLNIAAAISCSCLLYSILLKLADMFENIESLEDAKSLVKNERSLQAIAKLEKLKKRLEQYGVAEYITFDLGMLSKYQYYTGVVFKAYTYGIGDAVVKGGRYDNLLRKFGKDTAAIGFVIVIDDLLEALSRQKVVIDVPASGKIMYYRAGDETDYLVKLAEAAKLRKEGIPTVLSPEITENEEANQ